VTDPECRRSQRWCLPAYQFEIVFEVTVSENERWRQLAEAVAREQDPAKMMALVQELNRVLAEKYDGQPVPTAQSNGGTA
jgi:hypothetical protein